MSRVLDAEEMPWEEIKALDEQYEKEAMEEWKIKNAIGDKMNYTSLTEREWVITFDKLGSRPHIERIKVWTPSLKKGAILFGPVGTGKSTLCKALINHWGSPDYRCLFISMNDALDKMRATFDNKDTNLEYEMDKLRRPSLLILDDLGTEKTTEWSLSQFFTVFENRARSGKHTWFTTNLDEQEIKGRYGSRIHDRLVQFCSWVKCDGQSFRQSAFKNEI